MLTCLTCEKQFFSANSPGGPEQLEAHETQTVTPRNMRVAAQLGCALCRFRLAQLTGEEWQLVDVDLPINVKVRSIQWPDKEHIIIETSYPLLAPAVPLSKSLRVIPRSGR